MTAYKVVRIKRYNVIFQFLFKSLNHRFINIDIKLPELLLPMENLIREKIMLNISRGSIQVVVSISGQNRLESCIDIRRVKSMMNYLNRNGIKVSNISLMDILAFTNHNKLSLVALDSTLRSFVSRTIDNIIINVIKQKEKEGSKMCSMIAGLLDNIARCSTEIEKITPKIEMEKQKMLIDRLNGFDNKLKQQGYNELKKIVMATFLQKSFFEEIKRLKMHVQRFRNQLLENTNAKELDFLSQEMHREITTLLNKADNVKVSYLGVKIKKYIEDIREILNNIE